jgi:uncharacterized protein (DUF4415 family)
VKRADSQKAKKPEDISQEDWDAVDFPPLSEEQLAGMRPAREVFPDIGAFPKPRHRGPQKAPTKLQATVRFDRDVIEYFRGTGRGWQTRMNETLRREVERQKRRAKS